MKKLFLAFILPFIFSYFNLHSEEWQQINIPQIDALSDIVVNHEGSIFVLGNNGYLLKSSNQYKDWNQIDAGLNGLLTTAYFDKQDNMLVFESMIKMNDFTGKINFSAKDYNSWTLLNEISPTERKLISSISYWEGDTIICFGSKVLTGNVMTSLCMKTTNRGQDWTEYPTGTEKGIRSACFNNNKLWACADDGNIIFSTDLGENWNISHNSSGSIKKVMFPDSLNGYYCGLNGLFGFTTDGGNTWKDTIINTDYNFWGLSFTNNKKGCLAGKLGNTEGVILCTNNGGISWQSTDTLEFPMISALIVNDTLNFALSNKGALFSSNLKSITGINDTKEQESKAMEIKYADGNITVFFNNLSNNNYSSIILSDINGNIIKEFRQINTEQNNFVISTKDLKLPTGCYFIQLQSADQSVCQKFLIN